jgi:hypothetical protein
MAELRDDWDDSEGGAAGPEAVSWKYSDPGDVFTGIILPPAPIAAPKKGYEVKQRRGKGRDKTAGAPQGLLVWPPQSDPNRGPMTEAEFARAHGDAALKEAQGVPMKVLTVLTNFRAKEFFSGKAKERANENPEFVDDGLRRYFIDGPDIPTKFNEALKALGQRATLPGMQFSVRLDKREPNKGGNEGETNRFSVKIEMPTPETLAVVDRYVAEAKAAAPAASLGDDPWATPATPKSEDPWAAGPPSAPVDSIKESDVPF